MKYIISFIVITMVFLSCQAHTTEETVAESVDSSQYPVEVERLGVQNLYDKAKWFLYCIHIDDTLNFVDKTYDKNVTYGMLPLVFDKLVVRSDSVEIKFFFYYKNQRVDRRLVTKTPTWGAVFANQSDSIVLYAYMGDAAYSIDFCDPPIVTCPFRDVNPLQPEVIKYIKENREKLDPWFRKEAIKKGIISD